MQFLSLKCSNCNAPIDISPDSLLNVCEYCGETYLAKDIENTPIYIVPTISKNQVINAFKNRMEHDRDMRGKHYDIVEVSGVYVPFYVSSVEAKGEWEGYRYEQRGKRRVRVHLEGKIDIKGDFPVLARKYAHEFGLAYIGPHLFKHKFLKFKDINWKDISLPVMSVDITENTAEEMVKDEFLDELAEKIKKNRGVEKFTKFSCSLVMGNKRIILYPLWTVLYRFKGGSYRSSIEGAKGQVIATMEPVFTRHRILYFLGAILLGSLSGVIWKLGVFFAEGVRNGYKALFAAGVGIVIVLGIAYKLAKNISKSVRIERK